MATLGASNLTLADLAKRQDPSGKTARIVEMLSQTNEILTDMVWITGNLATGNQSVLRTSLPGVGWRQLNQGTNPTKSTTTQSTDTCAIMEAWSEVDVELAKLAEDVGAFRVSESASFLEAMGQEHAQTLFYGNYTTAPEEFNGFATRYNSLAGTNAQNIIDAAGTGSDNTSIYLICWGDQTVHGIIPKGSQGGLQHEDKGVQTAELTAGLGGGRMDVYRDKFTWKTGLGVKDWRYVVRACNIDISNLVANSSAADLYELLI